MRLLSAVVLMAMVVGGDASAGSDAQPDPSTITVFSARSIITMNPEQPRASMVAVRDGTILAVGEQQDVQQVLAGRAFRVDNTLADHILMPGFVEPHLHPYLAGILLQMKFITPHPWTLLGQTSEGVQGDVAYADALSAYERSLPEGQWLKTWGYHHYFHGALNRAALDRVSQSRPILVWHRSFHEVYLNTAAMAALGIEDDGRAMVQADYANGHFFETGLSAVLPKLMPVIMEPAAYMAALNKAARIIHEGGITSLGDGAFGSIDLGQELSALTASDWNSENASFRSYLLLDGMSLGSRLGLEDTAAEIDRLAAHPVSSHIQVQGRQIKLFVDGAAYSQLMQMRDGYLDGHHGEWMMPPERLETSMRFFWLRGYQIHLHINGDAGVDLALDILGRLQQENPRDDHRTTIHHFAYARVDQIPRIADLGVSVQANPYYVWALADKYADVGLGPERAAAMVPAGSVTRAGIALAFHSDFTMAPAQPLLLAWAAATRLTASGRVVSAHERVSVDEALQAITIDAAFQLRREHEIGSIAVGKKADFSVLEQDPYAVSPEQLKDIPLWGTVFEGRLFPLQH